MKNPYLQHVESYNYKQKQLNSSDFAINYKLIRNETNNLSLNRYGLYLNLLSKCKIIVKQINFRTIKQLKDLIDQIRKYDNLCNQLDQIVKIERYCVRLNDNFNMKKSIKRNGNNSMNNNNNNNNMNKTNNKNESISQLLIQQNNNEDIQYQEGTVLLLYQHNKTLLQLYRQLGLNHDSNPFNKIQFSANKSMQKSQHLTCFPQNTLQLIMKKSEGLIYKIYNNKFITNKNTNLYNYVEKLLKNIKIVPELIQIKRFNQIDQQCKIFIDVFDPKNIIQQICCGRIDIQNTFVGEMILERVNQLENEKSAYSSFSYDHKAKNQIIEEYNDKQRLFQSCYQSLGLVILKIMLLGLYQAEQSQGQNQVVNLYRMSEQYKIQLNKVQLLNSLSNLYDYIDNFRQIKKQQDIFY